jgi:hypothetical protein
MDLIVSWRFDPHSSLHLRVFAGQVVLLVLCCTPALLIDQNAPVLFISLLRTVSGLTAFILLIFGFFVKKQTPEPGLGPWDHCLGFVLLQLGCSIALHVIR